MEFRTEFSDGKRVLLIMNPKAGKTTSKTKIDYFKKTLEKYGFRPTLYLTEYAKHSTELVVKYGEEYDMVVCSGGDGTLNEVVSGLMQLEKRPILGYLPAGTTNDFAKTMRLPKLVEQSVAMMARGKLCDVDCGTFNGECFVYVASFGAFTKVSYSTPQSAKNMFGRAAYIFDSIQSAFEIRPYHAKVTTDDAVYVDDFIFGSVTNALNVGGVLTLPREMVNFSDGKFEVLLIKNIDNPENFSDTIRACIDMNYDSDNVILTQSSSVTIEFDEDTPFTKDGEFAGSVRENTVKCISPGYKLLVP